MLTIFLLSIFSVSLSDSWRYPYNETEWGRVSATCVEGTMQSPVDLVAHSGIAQTKLDIMYSNPTDLHESDEHELTWYEESDNPPTILLDDVTYALSKVQCHFGSEHTVEGFRYVGSCHFVHQVGSKYVVIAVFINDGASIRNAAFDGALENVDLLWGTMISGLNLRYYWEYTGSFTTPNCEENVQWIILRDVIEITTAQVEQAKEMASFDNNFRDPMPLNGRAVRDGSEIGNLTVLWFVVTGYCPEEEARNQLTKTVAEVIGLRVDEMVVLHIFELHGGIPNLYNIEYKLTVVDNTESFMNRFMENVGANDFDNGNVTRAIMNRFKAETNIALKFFSHVRAMIINYTFWSYPYDETEWGRVSATCVEGTMQSPVDLVAHSGIAQTKLDIMYSNPTTLSASYEHELTWHEDSDNPPTILLGNMAYALSKVQCHIGSEHTVDGFRYAGSCHFMHQVGNKYVVIAVIISDDASTTNAAFDDALQDTNLLWGTMISGLNLRYYWEYTGSFTTPNCEENVQWIILRDFVKVTPAQIEQMKDIARIDNNFRDPMPLNGRAVRDGSEIGNFTVIWYVVTGYCPEEEARNQLTNIVAEVLGLRVDEMVVLHIFELHGGIPNLYDIEYKFNVVDNTKSFMDRFLENVGANGFDNGNVTETIKNRFKAETNITLKFFSDVRATLYNSTFSNGDGEDNTVLIIVVVVVLVILLLFFLTTYAYMRKRQIEKQVALEIMVDGENEPTAGGNSSMI